MKLRVFILFAVLCRLACLHAEDLSSWSASDGHVIQAKFIKLDGESVVLEKDGKQFNVPFTKLTPQCVEQAKRSSQPLAPGKPEPSINDLVISSAVWKQRAEPNYRCNITESLARPAPYPRWLPGPKGTRLEFNLRLSKGTTFVAEFGRANAPADACLLLDNKEVGRIHITTKTFKGAISDAKEGPLGEVNEDLWCYVPEGEHTLTVFNAGTGWIEVPTVRLVGLGPKAFHVERKPVKHVLVREVVKMIAPNLQSRVWGVGIGTFPSDDGQVVHDLQVKALNAEYKVSKLQDKTGQDFLKLESTAGPGTGQTISVEVVASVTLYSRTLVPGAASTPPIISDADQQRYTKLYERKDIEVIETWMKQNNLVRGAAESDLNFAQRAVNVFRHKLRYKWDPSATRGPVACVRRGWGACDGLNGLVVEVLKLSHIPARTRPGRNVIGTDRPFAASTDGTFHVAAEFWADGIGWVPIEVSTMSGPSLTVGGALTPSLGISQGEHLNKHYDSVYIDSTKRTFQLMDFPFGSWKGSWDGWHLDSSYGYQPVAQKSPAKL